MRNLVVLRGNVGKDAELKTISTGSACSVFSLATTEKWKDKNGVKQEKTEWHTCELWGKQAEALSKYVTKGKQVEVIGSIKYESWEKDGVTKYFTKIMVKDFDFVSTGEKQQSSNFDSSNIPF